ncbi:hypothetical protein [Pseudorhodobacter sp. E13]|uniref:hypothetical protein n=1 Tax=Pseudorhodobacter sp. E13 TaxID=2487931 RepID=UPI000F8C803C|nr:hypothetical protein [Pseudorhodobacter sp. E13]
MTLCEVRKEFCEGRHRGKTQSSVAEERARNSPELRRAIQNHSDPRIRGGESAVNRERYVRYDNADPNWNRRRVDPRTIQNHLDNIERQIRRQGARILATRAGQAAARSWLKIVPILNIISTAYDVYDIASAGVDIVQQIQAAREQFSGDVYRIRPDVAVTGPNGQLQAAYDFKFDTDDWQPGQQELYAQDLRNSGAANPEPQSVNAVDCGCDGPARINSAGAVG